MKNAFFIFEIVAVKWKIRKICKILVIIVRTHKGYKWLNFQVPNIWIVGAKNYIPTNIQHILLLHNIS